MTLRQEARPRRRGLRSLPSTLLLWLLALGFIIPVAWFILSSFKPGSELFSLPLRLFPEDWTISGYTTAWNRFNFAQYFLNTSIVAVVTTVLTVLVSAMTGYAFAKYKAWWLKFFFICVLATTMLPTEVIMPSSFAVVRDLGLYNTLAGIIVPSIITATGIFMFRQYFKTIPDELLEAARVDGAGEYRIFFRIVLPLCGPALATLGVLTFLASWNSFLWPLVVASTEEMYTLPVALALFSVGQQETNLGLQMAGSLVVVLPVILLFFVMQRWVIQGISTTGIK